MTPVLLLALVAAAAPAETPTARVLLKAAAAGAPACRTTKVDGQLVRADLFARASQQCPVAKVGEDVIELRELAGALELGHMSRSPRAAAPAGRPGMDFTPALERLITGRLVVQEAREMGLDEDPKFRAALEDFRTSRLRALLQREATRGVKPDPAEVERLYRDAVRESKIRSVLLEQEDAAKAFQAALKAGGAFDAVAKKFVAEKKAKGGEKAEFVGPKHMLPEIRAAIAAAKKGAIVGPVKVPSGWVMLRVDGTRLPPKEDKAAREAARKASLARKEHEATRAFYLSLVKKHAKTDAALLKQLDLEAKGEKGFQEALADKRPLATIRGEAPITVGDLANEISMKFFHGLAGPIEQKRVNVAKEEAFERLLGMRLFAREAAARKLAERPEYRREVAEYERALTFNTFVEKVIAPDVKVTEADTARYYEQHKAELTAPQMYKLDGFAFAKAGDAQAAIEKLKAGTDFVWLRSSAPGQVPPEKRSLQFDGGTLSANALPRDLAKALTGTRAGDYRLYAATDSEVYVIRVVEQTPPTPQPYVEARETIAKKLFNERLADALRDYAGKLRAAQPVDVLVTRVSF